MSCIVCTEGGALAADAPSVSAHEAFRYSTAYTVGRPCFGGALTSRDILLMRWWSLTSAQESECESWESHFGSLVTV